MISNTWSICRFSHRQNNSENFLHERYNWDIWFNWSKPILELATNLGNAAKLVGQI